METEGKKFQQEGVSWVKGAEPQGFPSQRSQPCPHPLHSSRPHWEGRKEQHLSRAYLGASQRWGLRAGQ